MRIRAICQQYRVNVTYAGGRVLRVTMDWRAACARGGWCVLPPVTRFGGNVGYACNFTPAVVVVGPPIVIGT